MKICQAHLSMVSAFYSRKPLFLGPIYVMQLLWQDSHMMEMGIWCDAMTFYDLLRGVSVLCER